VCVCVCVVVCVYVCVFVCMCERVEWRVMGQREWCLVVCL